jgi:hypothetical protein
LMEWYWNFAPVCTGRLDSAGSNRREEAILVFSFRPWRRWWNVRLV